MKRKNNGKRLAALASALMLAGLLAGCGGEEPKKEYPVVEPVDISGMELLTAEDETVKYQVPSDKWVAGTNVNDEVVVIYMGADGLEDMTAINVKVTAWENGTPLDETFVEEVTNILADTEMGVRVETCELRTFKGETICYIEVITQYTDKAIDNLLEYGVLTEDELEKAGGRDYFKSIKTEALMTYAISGEHLITCGGGHATPEQKEAVLEAINVIWQTAEIK